MAQVELHNGYALWHYVPTIAAAIVFIVVFSLLTIGHAFRMFRHRMWFCIPIVIGGICKSHIQDPLVNPVQGWPTRLTMPRTS